MQYHKILDAIRVPLTSREIEEKCGLTHANVKYALESIRKNGHPVQTLGHRENTHYYLPECNRANSVRTRPRHQQLDDLMGDDLWNRQELLDILEWESNTLNLTVGYMRKKKGYVIHVTQIGYNDFNYQIVSRP